MTAISKTSPPSLFDSCIYIVFPIPILKQNSEFLKRARFLQSLHIVNEIVSRIDKDNLSVYPLQKNNQDLISKSYKSRANNSQKFNNHHEFESSNSIATYGILIITIICNYLHKHHALTAPITVQIKKVFLAVLKSLKPAILGPIFLRKPFEMKRFMKCLEHLFKPSELLVILGLFCGPWQIQTKFEKYSRHFCMSPKMTSISETFYSQELMKVIAGDKERVQKFPGKPEILDQFDLQWPLDMKLYKKDLEQFLKLPETLVYRTSLETELPNLESYRQHDLERIRKSPEKLENLDTFFQEFELKMKFLAKHSEQVRKIETKISQDRMKDLEMCYSCEEMISKKKFFDERRFGILNKCDCLICYGCLRKMTGTYGVVMGPINCPSCSVKSDIVAANSRWIEGKEKLKFFELLQEHEAPQMKCNMQEFSFMSPNRINFRASETVKEPLLRPLQLDIVSANASCIEDKEKFKYFDLLQIKEASNIKFNRTQLRDLPASPNLVGSRTSEAVKAPISRPASPNLVGSRTSEAVKAPISRPFKLDTVATNASCIDGKGKPESVDLLRKRVAPKMKLDRTVFPARYDYFRTRVPIMGLVN